MANSTPSERIPLAELSTYLTSFFEAVDCRDMAPNGLQVSGATQGVGKIVTGVSACIELFERAAELEADAVLVHHGLFWKGASEVLTGVQYRRVRALLEHDLALLAYHLPLDRHPELGNNALIARGLGLEDVQPFGTFDGLAIGMRGELPTAAEAESFISDCETFFGQQPFVFPFGAPTIRRIGVVSGAAERAIHEAIDLDLDLFITGEVSEWVMNLAREADLHFLAAGHYATETFGVRALGEHLASRFGIESVFVDVPNPV